MHIRPTLECDLPGIADILGREIQDGVAHFGIVPPSVEEVIEDWKRAMPMYPWFTALGEEGGPVQGFARAGRWKPREAYDPTVEIGVYVRQDAQGKGVGTALYRSLLPDLQTRDFHLLVAGIRLPNEPCVRLHERFGFQKVAHFPEMGFKFGQWHDVGYWSCRSQDLRLSQLPTSPTR